MSSAAYRRAAFHFEYELMSVWEYVLSMLLYNIFTYILLIIHFLCRQFIVKKRMRHDA